MVTQKNKILKLLGDHNWHSVIELHEICWRYGGRLFDLRRDGYVLEKRKLGKLEDWKLISTQPNLI